MTGPAVSKHLRVLERAGLVSGRGSLRRGRRQLEAAPLEQVADWAEEFRQFWDERFDRLDDYLTTMATRGRHMRLPWPATFQVSTPDDVAIVVRREFGAPAWRVWRAMTEPEHMVRWLGNDEFPLTTCEMDVRVGGRYRWVFGARRTIRWACPGRSTRWTPRANGQYGAVRRLPWSQRQHPPSTSAATAGPR